VETIEVICCVFGRVGHAWLKPLSTGTAKTGIPKIFTFPRLNRDLTGREEAFMSVFCCLSSWPVGFELLSEEAK
jgi:hypothetical protein